MKNKTRQYIKQYEWSNILAMLQNNRREPIKCLDNCNDKLVVITGATSGIGYTAAHKYASHGAKLICVNRNKEKSEALCKAITSKYQVECNYLLADLNKLCDTHKVANELLKLEEPIDILIHNAGVYLTTREQTEDELEKVFMVNYLSSFIINYKLKEKLKEQAQARIILVNSEGHRFALWGIRLDDMQWNKRSYSGLKSYGSAKTAQLLSMISFTEYFKDSEVTINAMHPGAVTSQTGQDNGYIYKWYKKHFLDKILKSPELSADALYYLGVSKELSSVRGQFFNLTFIEEPAPPALDTSVAKDLWKLSLKIGKLE